MYQLSTRMLVGSEALMVMVGGEEMGGRGSLRGRRSPGSESRSGARAQWNPWQWNQEESREKIEPDICVFEHLKPNLNVASKIVDRGREG
jgi:hypothetical protein